MCIDCFEKGITNKNITREYEDCLNIVVKDPEYCENFSPLSINYLAHAAIGVNGDKARIIARLILEKYLEWRSTRNYKRCNSLWYKIKHQLYLSFKTKKKYITIDECKFNPDDKNFTIYYKNIISIDRKKFNNGKYENIPEIDFTILFYTDNDVFQEFNSAIMKDVETLHNIIEKPLLHKNIIIMFGCFIGIGLGALTGWILS